MYVHIGHREELPGAGQAPVPGHRARQPVLFVCIYIYI